jgi:hypothetical protein
MMTTGWQMTARFVRQQDKNFPSILDRVKS